MRATDRARAAAGIVVVLAGAVLGCSAAGGRSADAAGGGRDGAGAGSDSAEAAAAGDVGAGGDGGDRAAGAGECTTNAGCPQDQFCSVATGRCVSDVVDVAAGTAHTCAAHRDGRVSCWGYGPFIATGLPVVTPPVPVPVPARASAVAVGIQAACALVERGPVWCWGDLGPGARDGAGAVVTGGGTPLEGVTQLAGGSSAFCGLTPAGTYCWGDNRAGELARPASMTFPPRTAVLAQPGPGRVLAASVAILVHDGGERLCGWGSNDSGIVPGPRAILEQPSCATMVPGVLQLSAGDGHVCARRGGRMFSCWGSNTGGQLGRGDEALAEAPLPGLARPLPAPVRAIAAGAYHTCALLETGRVSCWGSNNQGECGVPSSAPIFAPTPAVPALGPRAVGLASGAGAQHTCAILDDGSVSCWGNDNEGQLGSGATSTSTGRHSADAVAVRW